MIAKVRSGESRSPCKSLLTFTSREVLRRRRARLAQIGVSVAALEADLVQEGACELFDRRGLVAGEQRSVGSLRANTIVDLSWLHSRRSNSNQTRPSCARSALHRSSAGFGAAARCAARTGGIVERRAEIVKRLWREDDPHEACAMMRAKKGGGACMADVSSLAVFVDFENLALGFQNRQGRFDIVRVLQRLVEKGKIIVKKGYADWSRYADYKRQLHESGLELIEIPRRAMTGKNSADIRLCVDAMDLCYSKEHIDTFVIVSGDSDFSPLVAKLKENGKRVIGLAMRKSTSDLLMNACDEFIFYEDLEHGEPAEAGLPGVAVPIEKRMFPVAARYPVALRRDHRYFVFVDDQGHDEAQQPSFVESTYGFTPSAIARRSANGGALEADHR
jgi:uncharacterized protein (TIGR00288 family)